MRIAGLVLGISAALCTQGLAQDPGAYGAPRSCDGKDAPLAWPQLREALEAAERVRETETYRFRVATYQRRLNARDLSVVAETAQVLLLPAASPIEAGVIERHGFIREAEAEWIFEPLTPSILLSPEFHASHCFRGLAFEPLSAYELAGVSGSFAFEEQGSVLILDYGFVNLPTEIPAGSFGGQLRLFRLPNGDWIVTSRWIRTPLLPSRDPAVAAATVGWQLTELREAGATVVEVLDASGAPTGFVRPGWGSAGVLSDEPPTARPVPPGTGAWLRGLVVDSGSREPIGGMTVRVGEREAVTDSAGWFLLRELPPGISTVEFTHIGYGEAHVPIELADQQETVKRFLIPARAIDLGGVVARERSREAQWRRALPVATQLLEGRELEELTARTGSIGEAVRNMNGLNVFYGQFYGPDHPNTLKYIVCIQSRRPNPLDIGKMKSRWCEMVEVFIDDMSVPLAGELLRVTPLTDFERIEYIPPLGATRWGYRASQTGVLLLYTKR